MFKRMSSFILISITVLCLNSYSWAVQGDTVEFSLAQAIDRAIKNDNSLKLMDDKIDLAKRRYNYAISMSKDAPNKYWGTDAQHIANKKDEILYPLQRKATLDELNWQKGNMENNLRIQITQQYYQILQKQQAIINQNSIISIAKKEYDISKKKVQAGNMTESALSAYEMSVSEAEETLMSMQCALDNMNINFNEALGLSLETKVNIPNTDLPLVKLAVDSIDILADSVVKASHDIQKLESDKLLKKTEDDILRQYSFYLPDQCENLEDDILNLEYDIRNKKADIELKIRTDYNDLLSLADNISIKKMDYDYKNMLYDIAKKRYDLGMNTYQDLINSQSDKDTSALAYRTAELDFFIAVQQFKLYVYPAIIE